MKTLSIARAFGAEPFVRNFLRPFCSASLRHQILIALATLLFSCSGTGAKKKLGFPCTFAAQCESDFCIDLGSGYQCSQPEPCTTSSGCSQSPFALSCELFEGKGSFCVPPGQSNSCIPRCEGRECGSDGCDGTCGTCPPERSACNSRTGLCAAECIPDCTGRQCGDNGCEGLCGQCSASLSCNEASGKCEAEQDPCEQIDCGNGTCVVSEEQAACECERGYHPEQEAAQCVQNRKLCVVQCSQDADCCYSAAQCITGRFGGMKCVGQRCHPVHCSSDQECRSFFSTAENASLYICTGDMENNGNAAEWRTCLVACNSAVDCCAFAQSCQTGAFPGWVCENQRCKIAECVSDAECRSYYAGAQVANAQAYICTDDYDNNGESEGRKICLPRCGSAQDCCPYADHSLCLLPGGRNMFDCVSERCLSAECLSDQQCRQWYSQSANSALFVCSPIYW